VEGVKDQWFAGEGTRAPKVQSNDAGLIQLLQTRDLAGIRGWAKRESGAFRSLQALLFEPDELLRWRAIEALGLAAAAFAESDLEPVRNLVRRLLFSLNEDSGMAGWHSPEAIGEILAQAPALIDEYGSILASYLHRPPFERGAHWAVARMAAVGPEGLKKCSGELAASLSSDDPYLRGLAVRALAALDLAQVRDSLAQLRDDPALLTLYDFESGELKETTVGELAQTARAALDRR
jgi:hypothetical protein